jgi:hypothetical protein
MNVLLLLLLLGVLLIGVALGAWATVALTTTMERPFWADLIRIDSGVN